MTATPALTDLLSQVPDLPDGKDRSVLVFVVDTPASGDRPLDAIGEALDPSGLVALVDDPVADIHYLAYSLDVQEDSEGWRDGSHLLPDESPA